MTGLDCDEARAWASLELDHEVTGDEGRATAREHVEACADCRRFVRRAEAVRHTLRFEAVGAVPDVSSRVRAALVADTAPAPVGPIRRRPRGRGMLATAACFVVGLLVGGLLVAERSGPRPAAAGVPERVAAAQQALRSLDADVQIEERGWQQAVPARSFVGHLSYAAPESLAYTMRDVTTYPGPAWAPNDVGLVVRGDASWSTGLRPCVTPITPQCGTGAPETSAIRNRAPFDDGAVAPLDLLVPVRVFAAAGPVAAEPESLGRATIDGRSALGVVTTAAQAAPLLDGLRPSGNLRGFHAADRVELWLDDVALVPLALRVVAGPGEDRAGWAAHNGYVDRAGDEVLRMTLQRVHIDDDVGQARFDPPAAAAGAPATDAGFAPVVDGGRAAARHEPSVPADMAPVRAGTIDPAGPGPAVIVRSWARGRSWLRLRITDRWDGTRMLGELGPAARPIRTERGSTVYVDASGTRVGIHAAGIDAVVEGSVGRQALLAAAEGLGLDGVAAPPSWDEGSIATEADARRVLPSLLVPGDLARLGFDEPSYRIEGSVVRATAVGSAGRSFTVIATTGAQLGPPLDIDAWGIDVRRGPGRFSAARGELEWVEAGVVYDLSSTTLSLAELQAVAAALRSP